MKTILRIALCALLLLPFLSDCRNSGKDEKRKTSLEMSIDIMKQKRLIKPYELTEREMELFQAVEQDQPLRIKDLVKSGADINAWNDYGETPLIVAAYGNKIKSAKILIANGANLNDMDEIGNTALIIASMYGHTEIAKLLVAAGADVNLASMDQSSPLYLAKDLEIVKLLLEHGADVNTKNSLGVSKLQADSMDGYSEIIRYLLEKGAEVNTVDRDGVSPLDWAIKYKRDDVITMLKAAGAKTGGEIESSSR
jgi:ankyrin repeat protein